MQKNYREELFQVTHTVCTWNILVDLQQIQIQEEHSRIYISKHILCILEGKWPQCELSHDMSTLHGMENQSNTKIHHKHLLWVWKYQYHQSGGWQINDVYFSWNAIQLWAMWKYIYAEITCLFYLCYVQTGLTCKSWKYHEKLTILGKKKHNF